MIVLAPNPLDLAACRSVEALPGETVAGFLARQDILDMRRAPDGTWRMALPVIVRRGMGADDCLLQAEWDSTLCADIDTLLVQAHPLGGGGGGGGGGKNVLAMVATIAVMVYAPHLAGALGSTLGVTNSAGLAALRVGVSLVGSMLINALLPTPAAPQTPTPAAIPSVDPVYNLAAQGNAARLGAIIPLQYGRLRIWPDLAATPWSELVGDDQYLHQLHCLGVGSYDVHGIYIEDTPISAFDEVSTQVVLPGQALTLFPGNVETSGEVSGQTLDGSWTGPFVASATGATCYQIAVDLWLPRGLGRWQDDGSLAALSLSYQVQAQAVDASTGTAIGDWVTLDARTDSGARQHPYGVSRIYPVSFASGRCQVRIMRTDSEQTDTRALHQIQWVGLRAYLRQTTDTGDVTLLAVRMRRTDNLSSRSERRINVDCTRQIRAWSSGGGWSVPGSAHASNPAWVIADLFTRRRDYTDTAFLAQLEALATTWAARGDTCAVRWSSPISLWEAARRIARTGRAAVHWEGGYLSIFRHHAAAPVARFSPRSIVRGSLERRVTLPRSESPDSLAVTYYERRINGPETMDVTLDGGTAEQAVEWNALEITDRNQAWREARYERAMQVYGVETVVLRTYLRGMLPARGKVVAISYPLLDYGQSAELTAVDGATLTVDRDLEWEGSAWQISLTRPNGDYDGPYAVMQGNTVRDLVLTGGALAWTPEVGQRRKRTELSFGAADEIWERNAVVLAKAMRGREEVELTLLVESDEVHAADSGTVPAYTPISALPRVTAPTIRNLSVTVEAGLTGTTLHIGWQAHPDAVRYVVQTSGDGASWVTTPTGVPAVTVAVPVGRVYVRVAAEGLQRGEWATWAYADEREAPAPPESLNVEVGARLAVLTWPPASNPFAVSLQMRWSAATAGAKWNTSEVVVEQIPVTATSVTIPARQGTYLLAVVDIRGVVGAPVTAVNTISEVLAMNVVEDVTETDPWPGTHTDTVVIAGGLSLAPDVDVFGRSDWFAAVNWFLADGGLVGEGIYEFAGTMDLGAIFTAQVGMSITAGGVNHDDDLFALGDVFERSDWFGVDTGAWWVAVELRTTDDDPEGSPTWGDWRRRPNGEVRCRALQARVVLRSLSWGIAPLVSSVQLTVDMPDRVVAESELIATSSGLVVTFTPPFLALRGLGIAAQGLDTGEYYEIVDKDAEGFGIVFRDSLGSAITRTFDYVAAGYGRVET